MSTPTWAGTTSDSAHSILILDDYQSAFSTYSSPSSLPSTIPVKILTSALSSSSTEEIVRTLLPFSILHLMRERTPLPREILLRLPNLRFITTTAMRNRAIELDTCRELGIVVSGTTTTLTPEGSNAVAGTVEQTWALILALTRRIVQEQESVRAGRWQMGIANGLTNKTLGLIGLGKLGQEVARVARAFGMKVVAWSPNLTSQRAEEAGVEFAGSLESLLRKADIVSLHLVLSSATRNLFTRVQLGYMKKTAYLINTSRGALINEEDLIAVLKEGRIAGVGLDVFDKEPLPLDHYFRTKNERVVLSPHMGYVDKSTYDQWWPQTLANIQAFLAGTPVRLLEVDPTEGMH